MPINRNDSPQDTRGLPLSMDPHSFYEYKSAQIVNGDLTGIEMLIWKIVPYNYIKSFAIAIDPLWKFKVSPARITAVNRTVTRSRLSVVDSVIQYNDRIDSTRYNSTQPNGCPRDDYQVRASTSSSTTTVKYKPTVGLKRVSKDTTYRTRPMGSDYGEAELFDFTISSPPRTGTYYNTSRIFRSPAIVCGTGIPRRTDYDYASTYTMGPSSSYLTQSTVDSIRSETKLGCDFQFGSEGYKLVRRALPTSRSLTYARSIVELRDLPRSIVSLQKTLGDLADFAKSLGRHSNVFDLTTSIKNIPNEYLSYHFGWKQLYNDLMSTLTKPQQVERRINRLLKRDGLATTFRANYHTADSYTRGSGFVYPQNALDAGVSYTHSVNRRFELTCSISARFKFPPVDRIKFREDLFLRMLGVKPSPIDMYELVPWTWLYDWFTGFGNYLELIEEINSDRSLINFGFLACKCKGSLVTSFRSFDDSYHSYDIDGSTWKETVRKYLNHSSSMDFSYYVRKDVTELSDIRATSDPSSLTTFQRTILGALVFQKSKF